MNKRILIVDDDPDILSVLKEALQFEKYQVEIRANTEEIIEILEGFKPHLILIDYLLNGINGGEICYQIKSSERYRHISVFIMSAYPKVLYSLGSYNADKLIEKPFDLYQLMDLIEKSIIVIDKPTATENKFLN